jgi:stage III sporulation protein AD
VGILQIVGIGVTAAILIVILKTQKPEIGIQASVIAGIAIFLIVAGKLASVINLLSSYTKRINIDTVYMTTLMKVIGIAYITEFGAEVCKDAGETAIASKIELAGKVVLIVIAAPIITSLLDLIIKIMP